MKQMCTTYRTENGIYTYDGMGFQFYEVYTLGTCNRGERGLSGFSNIEAPIEVKEEDVPEQFGKVLRQLWQEVYQSEEH